MKTRRRVHALLALAAIFAATAAPLLAHGWIIPPPPPFTGPIGGGQAEYTGPQGGGDPNQGGTTEPGQPPGEVTNAQPAAGTPTPPRGRGGTTPGGAVRGAAANPGRGKSTRSPWLERLAVPWQAVFPSTEQGYGVAMGDLTSYVKAWSKSAMPSVVVVFDSADKRQVAALEALDNDQRFVAACQLFNCFKLDARGLGKGPVELKLATFRADGSAAGEAVGESRVRKGLDLLADAWKAESGKELSKILPRLSEAVSAIAYCDYCIEQVEPAIVCPDCGHERHDAVERIAEMKVRRGSFVKVVEDLRSAP